MPPRTLSESEIALRLHQCLSSSYVHKFQRIGLRPWAKWYGTKQSFLLNFWIASWLLCRHKPLALWWELRASQEPQPAHHCSTRSCCCLPQKKKSTDFLSFVLCKGKKISSVTIEMGRLVRLRMRKRLEIKKNQVIQTNKSDTLNYG